MASIDMGSMSRAVEIVGAGLAGCSLAWQLSMRGVSVRLLDSRRDGEASRVAAGLINPVTGKNYEPSWRIAEFLPESIAFFKRVESMLGTQFWFPHPVIRLVTEKDWSKVSAKLEREEVRRWVRGIDRKVDGWYAAVELHGGGRVDVRAFCEKTVDYFSSTDDFEADQRIICDGAFGLIQGRLGEHRCAKGEILTVKIPDLDESHILIGAGGWLVPIGGGLFKVGSTYEWDELDGNPTAQGLERLGGLLKKLGVASYGVIAHEAGVRPIVRRSMPLIGSVGEDIIFNGLGSKGSLYAPGTARRLADWLVDGLPIEDELDVGKWLKA